MPNGPFGALPIATVGEVRSEGPRIESRHEASRRTGPLARPLAGSVAMAASVSIFHIADPIDADRLCSQGWLRPRSLAAEGFVHCSTADQVVVATERHLAGVDDLVLIEFDPSRLDAELRWPAVYPGERFPHVHGPLNGDAVVAVHPWRPPDREAWAKGMRG